MFLHSGRNSGLKNLRFEQAAAAANMAGGAGSPVSGMSEWTKEVADWREAHFAGFVVLDPDKIEGPKTSFRARDFDAKHKNSLKESFVDTATTPKNVEVVIFDWNWETRLASMTYNEKINMTNENLLMEINASISPAYAVSGDHTAAAMRDLKVEYPDDEIWSQCKCDVYVCAETAENDRFLKIIGNQNNKANSKYKDMGFKAVLLQYHQKVVEITNMGESPSDTRKLLSQYKKDLAKSMGMKENSVGSMYQLAKQTGDVWTMLWKIVVGGFKISKKAVGLPQLKSKKSGKTKASTEMMAHPLANGTKFQFLFSLPPQTYKMLLRKVVTGEWVLDYMYKECSRIKVRMRIRAAIEEYLLARGVEHKYVTDGAKDGPEGESPDFQAYRGTFPWIKTIVHTWQDTVARSKAADALPNEIIQSVVKHLLDTKKVRFLIC